MQRASKDSLEISRRNSSTLTETTGSFGWHSNSQSIAYRMVSTCCAIASLLMVVNERSGV